MTSGYRIAFVTAQHLFRVDFKEIRDFRVTCSNCRAEIVIPIERELARSLDCPGCNKRLWDDGRQDQLFKAASHIRAAIHHWQEMDYKEFSLSFSLPAA